MSRNLSKKGEQPDEKQKTKNKKKKQKQNVIEISWP